MTFNLRTFPYPEYYLQEDWGLVTQSSTETVNLGLVTSPDTEREDYGSILTTQQELLGYQDQRKFIFDLDNALEEQTYSYNERSIFIFDGYEDHGVISVFQLYDDYGLLTDSVPYEDFGTLGAPFNETVYPYGTVQVSGSAVTEFLTQFIHRAEGSAEFSGVKVEKNTFREIGSGSFSAITGAAEETTVRPPVSGTAIFSGNDVEKSSFREIGSGSFSAIAGAAEVSGVNPPDSTVLFTVSGNIVEKSSFREIGSGSFSAITGAAEETTVRPPSSGSAVFSGVKVEKNTFREIGSGSFSAIAGAAEVSGVNPPDSTVLFTVSGTKVEKNTFREIGSGSFSAITGAAEVSGVNPPDQTLLFELSGTKVEKSTFVYNERSIFIFDGYEDHGVISVFQLYDDYGLLTDNVVYEEFGSIGAPYNENVYPFGTVQVSGSAVTEFLTQFIHRAEGSAEFSGVKVEKSSFREIGSGSFSTFNGAAESTGSNPPDSTLLFELSGTKVERNTYSYNEKSIILAQSPDNYGSIGSTATTFIDYGSVADSELTSGVEDYRYIYYPGDAYPYGTVEISGSAVTELLTQFIHRAEGSGTFSGVKVERNTFREIGSGSAVFSGTAVEKNEESFFGSGSAVLSGVKVEKSSFREIGSGSFSAIAGAAEVSGVNPPDSTVLFTVSGVKVEKNTFREIGSGSFSAITGAAEETTVRPPVSGTATLSGVKVEKSSFREIGSGSFSTFNGAAEVTGVNPPDQTLLFELSGVKVEKSSFREIGSGSFSAITGAAEVSGVNPPDSTLLFELSGTKVEKSTFVYNERSIFIFDGYEDHGVISVFQLYDDYGLLTDSVPYEDFGTISAPFNETVYPYGTVEISGSAVTELLTQFIHRAEGSAEFSGVKVEKNTFREIGSGSFSAITGAAEVSGVNPPNSGLIIFSGVKVEKSSFREIGSGSFSAITGAAEATGVNPPDSTVLFTVSGTKVEKSSFREIGSGSFSAITGSAEEFTVNPPNSGSITVSGNRVEKSSFREIGSGSATFSGGITFVTESNWEGSGTLNISGTIVQNNSFRKIGSGTFSAITGAAEVSGVNPPDQTLLFELSGTKVEKSTFVYNERSIFIFDGYEDHGVISVFQLYDDYGLLTDSVPYEDFGTLGAPFNETVYPYGTVQVSGSITQDVQIYVPHITGSGSAVFSGVAPQSFKPATAIGSGSFSAIAGAAEVSGVNPPDSTVLFIVSGTKDEKNSFREIGSGSAVFSGAAVEKNEESFFGSGSAAFSGVAPQSFKPATAIGSGSFSAITGAAEAIEVNPPDRTVLFELSGTKVEKSSFREIGSGSAVFSGTAVEKNEESFFGSGSAEFSGVKVEKNTFREIGSGSFSAITGAAEATGVNPPDSTVLFTVSGVKVEKSSFREIGSGSAVFAGESVDKKNPGFAGRGTIEVSGSSPQAFTPATAIGSGTFSAVRGSAESTGVNPPDSTVLFTVSGAYSNLKATFAHQGSGSAVFSGEADIALEALAIHEGGGLIQISGSAPQSFTPTTEIGSGSFSTFNGAAESTGSNPPDSTVLFTVSGAYSNLKATFAHQGSGSLTVSGTAVQKTLPSHYGSGTLSAIRGAAESTLFNPPDSTVLFTVSGTKVEKNTFREIGSGSFSVIIGSVESAGANPPDSTVLFTVSGSKLEKNTFRNIGSGTVQVLGNSSNSPVSKYIGVGSAVFSGVAPQSFIPATAIGSGSFSAFNGAAESVGANPPENTALFDLSGTKIEKRIFREIGSGSIISSGSMTQNVQVYVPNITGSGSISISDTAIDRFRPNYKATGTIAIIGTGKESYTPTTAIGGGLIEINGVGISTYLAYVTPYVFITII